MAEGDLSFVVCLAMVLRCWRNFQPRSWIIAVGLLVVLQSPVANLAARRWRASSYLMLVLVWGSPSVHAHSGIGMTSVSEHCGLVC